MADHRPKSVRQPGPVVDALRIYLNELDAAWPLHATVAGACRLHQLVDAAAAAMNNHLPPDQRTAVLARATAELRQLGRQ